MRVEPLLHELDVGGRAPRHPVGAALPELGRGDVQHAGHDHRVGRQKVDVDQIGALARRCREVGHDLGGRGLPRKQVHRVDAVFLGRRLHLEAHQRRLDAGSDRGRSEHLAGDGSQLGVLSGVVVRHLELLLGCVHGHPDVTEQVGSYPAGLGGAEAQAERVHHRGGDGRRAQHLDLGLDRIDEDIEPGDMARLHQPACLLRGVVHLEREVGLVVDTLA